MIYPNKSEVKMPEMWLPVNRTLKNVCPCYLVSSYGRIYNDSTGNFLPINIYYNKDKYINIRLSTIDGSFIQEMMQRIVMYTFAYKPGCENLDVNHLDGIKYHNWLWNLEWVTHKENMDHALNNNLFRFGEDRKNTKITNEQAEYICLLLSCGIHPKDISNKYDIPRLFYKGKSSTTIESEIIYPIEFINNQK